MATFKTKPEKTKFLNKIDTLDARHKKIIKEFDNDKINLPHLKNLVEQLNAELQKLNDKDKNLITTDDIKKKSEIKNRISELNQEIFDIEDQKKEMDYFGKVYELLFEYYDGSNNNNANRDEDEKTRDSKKSDSESDTDTNISTNIESQKMDKLELLHKQNIKNKKIKKATKKRFDKEENEKKKKTIFDYITKNDTDNNQQNINSSPEYNKADIYDKYLSLIDNDYNPRDRKKTVIHKCENCGIEKILNHIEGTYVCVNCGEVENVIIESEIPNYKETGTEKPAYPYKRINHLIECLNQLQAKETSDIPDEIYDKINQELKKYKILDPKDITVTIIRTILKKLKLNKYYEHVSHIKSKITHTQAPMLGKNEALIIQMFKMTQEPFEKYRPKGRKNYIHYGYFLRKILQLLGLKDLMEYYPLLKSRDKLRILDKIWEKICRDLNWKYYSS